MYQVKWQGLTYYLDCHLHQTPVVLVASLGAEVPEQRQSSATRLRRAERLSFGGGTWGTDLTLSGQSGAISSPGSCLSIVWDRSWQKTRHLEKFCKVVRVTIIQMESSCPIIFFEDLGITAKSWGLCHTKLFSMHILNDILNRSACF